MTPVTHIYIGRRHCGCVVAAVVDDPDRPKWTGKEVWAFIKNGYAVERVTLEHYRANIKVRCNCERPAIGGAA